MRKKTSTIIGLAIATILTAYISAITMSNHAFAQIHFGPGPGSGEDSLVGIHSNTGGGLGGPGEHTLDSKLQTQLAGHEAQLGLNHLLEGQQASVNHAGLGCDPWDPRGC